MVVQADGKEKISPVSPWELVSFTSHFQDGRNIEPWPGAVGRIAYDADGHVTSLLISGRRNEADGCGSPLEAQGEFNAYFGTYHVDFAKGVIIHDVSASLSATRESKELRRSFELKNGTLILSFPTIRNGVPMTNRIVCKRISAVDSQSIARPPV